MSFEKPKSRRRRRRRHGRPVRRLLAEGGLDVTLVDASAEHIAAIKTHGIRIVGVGGDRDIPIKATADAARDRRAPMSCCSSASRSPTERRRGSVKHLFTGETAAISFQNGLGNEAALESVLGKGTVLAGLTAQAGLVEAPGVVRNFGNLPTHIGEMAGGLSDRAVAIAKAFTRHGLPTTPTADIKREKWKKLLGNVALGAISAVTDFSARSRSCACRSCARPSFGSSMKPPPSPRPRASRSTSPEAREVLMKLVDTTGGGTGTSKSSMREDIIRRRQTEIDTIHGAVAGLAASIRHRDADARCDDRAGEGPQGHYLDHGKQG